MIRSLVLFVHITGVLTMFAGLALEAFGVEAPGKVVSRIAGLAGALTLLSGLYLGAHAGVLGRDWMRASYGGIAVMVAAGTLAQRSEALRRISLQMRAVFGLAVVFLMTARPDALVSVVVLGIAVGVSALAALPTRLTPHNLSSTGA
jgi:hypothetical protein